MNEGYLPTIKNLGVLWIAKEGVFTSKANVPDYRKALTKRRFLSQAAALFDPMGFLAPFTIRANILLQEIWSSGIDWDEELNQDHARKVHKWLGELQEKSELSIPSNLQLEFTVKTRTLHTFLDASGDTYGAAVYARCEYDDGFVSVR